MALYFQDGLAGMIDYLWKDGSSKMTQVKALDDSHIKNILRYLKKKHAVHDWKKNKEEDAGGLQELFDKSDLDKVGVDITSKVYTVGEPVTDPTLDVMEQVTLFERKPTGIKRPINLIEFFEKELERRGQWHRPEYTTEAESQTFVKDDFDSITELDAEAFDKLPKYIVYDKIEMSTPTHLVNPSPPQQGDNSKIDYGAWHSAVHHKGFLSLNTDKDTLDAIADWYEENYNVVFKRGISNGALSIEINKFIQSIRPKTK